MLTERIRDPYTLCSYVTKRKRRTKKNSSYSEFKEINSSVPEGFTTCMCDLFCEVEDLLITNYAGVSTPFALSSELQVILTTLKMNAVESVNGSKMAEI